MKFLCGLDTTREFRTDFSKQPSHITPIRPKQLEGRGGKNRTYKYVEITCGSCLETVERKVRISDPTPRFCGHACQAAGRRR